MPRVWVSTLGKDLLMTWMRRAVGPLVAMIVMLALAGCSGGDPEPKIAPTPSSPATSASPSEPSPTPERLSPEETVRAWVEAQNEALVTGDTTRLEELSAEPCEPCDQFIEPIQTVYEDGGHFSTDGWTVVAARARPGTSDPVIVDAGISIAGGRTLLEAGGEPVVYDMEKHILVFKLIRQHSRQVVSFIGFIS